MNPTSSDNSGETKAGLAALSQALKDSANLNIMEKSPEALLATQAQILDSIFNHLIVEALDQDRYQSQTRLETALKAQEQCHKTLRRLKKLASKRPPALWEYPDENYLPPPPDYATSPVLEKRTDKET